MNDRSSFRLASALVFGGELLYIGAGSVSSRPACLRIKHPEVFAEYANSAYWGAVHMGQFMGMAVLLSGIVAFWRSPSPEGAAQWIGWPGEPATSAVVTIALTGSPAGGRRRRAQGRREMPGWPRPWQIKVRAWLQLKP